MPKIKVKNIPTTAREMVCNKMYLCSECPFHLEERFVIDEDTDTGCMVDFRYDPKETVVELPNEYFPTNREWLESLSNKDLAAFYTHGVLIERYSPYPINIHQIIGGFIASQQGIEYWLSQPCRYLMENEQSFVAVIKSELRDSELEARIKRLENAEKENEK